MELFNNEEITFEEMKIDSDIQISDNDINEKYKKGEIRIITEQARYPLSTITSLLESDNYVLNPEFQRRHRWDVIKKSRLIESFIMNVPIPPIFLYEVDYSVYEVMDGLQRLTAVLQFYKNEYKLKGLEEWRELNNLFYKDLPEQVKKGIDRRYISSIILLQETAKNEIEAQRLKQLVFERINSGGVHLEPQETRNALYDGPLNKLCLELSRNEYLCKTWGIPHDDSSELIKNRIYRKMGDVELVLRFFAYRQIEKTENSFNLNEFLDHYINRGNKFEDSLLNKLENLFEDTIEFVFKIFGKRAFYLYRIRSGNWNWYNRPTKVVYDPLMQVMSQYLDHKKKLIREKKNITKKLAEFYKDNYDEFGGRNTNKNDVIKRKKLLNEFFKQFI